MFYDDELNVDPGMVDLMSRIAAVQRALGVEWRLRGFIKSELFTDEQAAVTLYEHSMGQSALPPRLLRTTQTVIDAARMVA